MAIEGCCGNTNRPHTSKLVDLVYQAAEGAVKGSEDTVTPSQRKELAEKIIAYLTQH